MSHKHCIFCGEEIPVPCPTNWSSICESPSNTMTPDTVGNRYHAFMISRDYKNFTAGVPSTPVETASPDNRSKEERALYSRIALKIGEARGILLSREELRIVYGWESQLTQVREELHMQERQHEGDRYVISDLRAELGKAQEEIKRLTKTSEG